MKRRGLFAIAAGMMATTAALAGVGPAPGPYPVPSPYDYGPPGGGTPNAIPGVWDGFPNAEFRVGGPDPYGYPIIPDLLGRAVELLGAISDAQDRSSLAEDWLSFTKQMIVQEMQYRQQWLNHQKQQSAQAYQIQQLQLQVAKLQKEVAQLRARHAQPEQGPSSQPAQPPAGPPTKVPGTPSSS
jgi:hypothetical protein